MTNAKTSTATEIAPVAPQVAPVGLERATPTTKARTPKKANKGQKRPNNGSHKKTAAKATSQPAPKVSAAGRANSKKARTLDLLRLADGATTAEIAKVTGWQDHSIRGFISGTVGKRMGLKVESARDGKGDRRYRITGK